MSGQGGNIRLILGDQLTHSISSLNGIDIERDVVLMVEVSTETTYVPHHKQKIAFILSAMRHFAAELVEKGIRLDYVKLDDPENTGSFSGEVERAIKRHRASEVIVTEPGEYRVRQFMEDWQDAFGISVFIRNDTRFFSHPSEFSRWAEGKKQLRMEFFYREMRRKTGLLMDGDQPAGGQWNFDADNRKPAGDSLFMPSPKAFAPDAVTQEVLALVEARFANHFGRLERFWFAVRREDAQAAFTTFVEKALPSFGDFQDAMLTGEPISVSETLFLRSLASTIGWPLKERMTSPPSTPALSAGDPAMVAATRAPLVPRSPSCRARLSLRGRITTPNQGWMTRPRWTMS
jgi:deoxyribodipyrimidine photolyase-related protein